MPTHIALLRAVNLGSHNKVSMANLRAMLDVLGLADGESLLQSGNLMFTSRGKSTGQLESMLERAAANELGLHTGFFVRTANEWNEMVDGNPYPGEAASDPGHLLVLLCKHAPGPAAVSALRAAIQGRETIAAAGTHAYMTYPDGVGRSKATTALIERKLGTSVTARNWNTVLKVHARLLPHPQDILQRPRISHSQQRPRALE